MCTPGANLDAEVADGLGDRLAAPHRSCWAVLHDAYDAVCETTTNSRFADPMRRDCSDLTEAVVHSGHWMAQEQPVAVNTAMAKWLAAKLPDYWNS